MNWSEVLPPPPEHPPPSDLGDPPSYQDIRGDSRSNTRSPMSPVSIAQLSACSCPNPHTQTPVPGWNMPVYSDNECPRCHSEKYYDPVTYCREAFIRRTNSPHTQLVPHVNSRNIPNSNSGMQMCSPHGASCGSGHYQLSQPHGGPQNSCTPVGVDNVCNNQSEVSRASHSSNSDTDTQKAMLCLQSYRLTPKSVGQEPRFTQEWSPGPAPGFHNSEQDSGMGMEEDGAGIDRSFHTAMPADHR